MNPKVLNLCEDTHKKVLFFLGRTIKRGAGGKPPEPLSKNNFIKGKNVQKNMNH